MTTSAEYVWTTFLPRAAAVWITQEVFQNTLIFHAVLWEITKTVNSLTRANNFITRELQKLQQVVLYNHQALDMILASRGGTCAVVGRDICSYAPLNLCDIYAITKNNQTVDQGICHIKTPVLIPPSKDALGPMS